jgi:peptide methionine sulfoxide reductase msrA/msrB
MKLNPLTPEEQKIMIDKGTEAPNSGKYVSFHQSGMFVCRRCDADLFRSTYKFDSDCGWPSFDDTVLGAIESKPDADGRRTEITCVRCGAHLGHVFLNENLTPKNTRYCVNSVSMQFVPKQGDKTAPATAIFGGGCFWCTEADFKMIKGVISVMPGYAGGNVKNPGYEEVSTGLTGHAEVVEIEYDPHVIAYEGLLEVFFAIHDPTTLNRQGNDVGTQYRSIILYLDDLQKEIADNFIERLKDRKIYDNPIVTEVKPLSEFYTAEEYHRDYFAKNPDAAYCQIVIAPKLMDLRKNLNKYLR